MPAARFDSVRTLEPATPGTGKYVLVVGDISYQKDPERAEWKATWTPEYRAVFEKGFREWVERQRGREWVVTADQGVKTLNSYRLVGTITRISHGIPAVRLFIGMGAGQAKIGGSFMVVDAAGTPIAAFDTRESYLGGIGIGGWDFIDMDTLVRRFAETTAEAAIERIEQRRTAQR